MAKFTSPIPLNLEYQGHILRGPAGTEFRIPDSLRSAFDEEFGTRVKPVWTVSDEIGSSGGGGHPDLATHISLGLISSASTTAHVAESDPHVQYALDADLANHLADTTAVHGIADTANISMAGHTHAHPDLATHDALGLATDAALAAHNHDAAYAATVHTQPYSTLTGVPAAFPPESHAHLDADIPAGIARDSEVTSAINAHAATPHGGGSGEVYAVGDLYLTTRSGNPATLLGYGTWAAFGAGRVIVGHDAGQTEFDTVEKTGGAKTHTLTTAEMPSHTHVENSNSATTGGLRGWAAGDTSTNTSTATDYSTAATGGGAAHNNLQPYIVAFVWKRTA